MSTQPPDVPAAAELDPAPDAASATALEPDSTAQPGQVQAQAAFEPNATNTAATTDATTTEPVAVVPVPENDATMAARAPGQDQGVIEVDGERHQEVPAPAQGDTTATAQETVSAQTQEQAQTTTPIDDSAAQRHFSGAFTTLPTVSETDTRATSDPAAAIPPPEPATDAAPPPPPPAEPPALAALPDELPTPRFVAPSSYLRPKISQRTGNPPSAAMVSQEQQPPSLGPYDKEQLQGLKAIRDFLKVRTSYDVLPLSFRLIVLDTNLLIKKSLNIMIQNSIVSAPLWDSQNSKFAGILTSTDYLNVIRYYCQFPDEMSELEQFRLSSLRAIEKAIGAIPIETVSVHPSRPLYEACRRMLKTRARRIPLVDIDDETGQEMVVSVITQYRILKFIAVNNEHNTVLLKKSVREIGLGSYDNLVTAGMMTSVLDAVGLMVDQNISCIPIVDKSNKVLNVFEAVDIIPCIKGGAYEELDGTVGDALCKRSDDSPGIYTCHQDDRLESIFDTIRKSRVHRLIVVDDENRLKGVISLSDILKYVLLYGEDDKNLWRVGHGHQGRSSRTWTASSGDVGLLSDTDDLEDRTMFVLEYNRLAKKHGLRLLILDDFVGRNGGLPIDIPEKRGWLQRLFRSSSNNTPTPTKSNSIPHPRHKRSVSDVAHHLAINRRDIPRSLDLQSMVRFSGKSVLYLPTEHAPGAIVLPTCIRATAQYLAHNALTRGLFRIPGSVKIVNALFDYYCYIEGGAGSLTGTVRCISLPTHIQSSVHDVASTFKKMLSILPGGILGSLAVFDAMVAIHSQLRGDPEFPRTKQTRVRARLIALAIGTIQSQLRRDLVCAVFGLLSLIGRIAEITPREDDNGRALPTADLMGYNALGIVFGPLLVGDLLDQYSMKITNPGSGLMLFPVTPQKLRRDRRKSKPLDRVPPAQTNVDKVIVANSIAEMLVTNWRDVVRQMKGLGAQKRKDVSLASIQTNSIRPSASEPFVIKKPQGWGDSSVRAQQRANPDESPEPSTPTMGSRRPIPRHKKSGASTTFLAKPATALSPTLEVLTPVDIFREAHEDDGLKASNSSRARSHTPGAHSKYEADLVQLEAEVMAGLVGTSESPEKSSPRPVQPQSLATPKAQDEARIVIPSSPHVSLSSVPPRTSSRPRHNMALASRGLTTQLRSSWDDSPESDHRQSREMARGRSSSRLVDGRHMRNESSPPASRKKQRSTTRPSHSSKIRKSLTSSKSRAQSTSTQSLTQKSAEPHFDATVSRSHETTQSNTEEIDDLTTNQNDDNEKRPNVQSTADNGANPLNADEYFYLSPNGEVERHVRSRPAEHVDKSSDEAGLFYAPMQTPVSLPGQVAGRKAESPLSRTGT
ncbi:CBS domain-containing protein [Sarocladium implicatum]|nr:CBS domain-containing protein [Sarocladium implicatum]